ncbi:hypothetical protein HMN09_01391500 [Mycena chlorophos]|uniref:Uncharacterized protein n=1 Tax=Mycena chlorophos TaxID=658473 RepID=A0A8H6VQK6_MYCCL|nr:hypothetical protein HMN09_01391500 [Mycena chlorophos]
MSGFKRLRILRPLAYPLARAGSSPRIADQTVPLHLCGAEQLESKTKKWAKLKALGRGIRKTLKFGSNAVIATIAVPLGATTLALALYVLLLPLPYGTDTHHGPLARALKFYHLATHIIPKDECGIIELILGLAILPVEIVLVITSVLTLGCVWVVLSEEDFDELWMNLKV